MTSKSIRALLLAVLAVLFTQGCNTIAGAGQDLQKAGETITGAAKK